MISIIASLMNDNGQQNFNAIQTAKKIWDDLLKDSDNISVEDLSEQLQRLQISRFEKECGGRIDGKFIMGNTAAAYYYDDNDGYGENESKAKKLCEAIEKSFCSLEVKGSAKRAFNQLLN